MRTAKSTINFAGHVDCKRKVTRLDTFETQTPAMNTRVAVVHGTRSLIVLLLQDKRNVGVETLVILFFSSDEKTRTPADVSAARTTAR